MKQVVLRQALESRPRAADFMLVDVPDPACPAGGISGTVIDLSLDPYVGSRIRGRHMGEPVPRPGIDPIPGAAIVAVTASQAPGIAPGDIVHTMDASWSQRVALQPGQFRRIDPAAAPLRTHLSILGMPGLTAWAGVTQLAKVRPGDVFLVDAAAGAVGGTAGQLAKLRGARVIGIAGSPEKCRIARDLYGFDACIDHGAQDWLAALDAALPGPVTVHIENVSTQMAAAAMARLAPYGRVVLCGLAAQYQADDGPAQLPVGLIIGRRAHVMGLVVYDFYPRWQEFLDETVPLVRQGRLRIAEDVVDGLEQAPHLFERLMNGANTGKCIVAVSPAPLHA